MAIDQKKIEEIRNRKSGYGTTIDNYKAQQEKKRKEEEKAKGPVSTQRLSLPKAEAPVSTQRMGTTTGRASLPSPAVIGATGIQSPALTQSEFNRSTAMIKSYGNYDNYLAGRRVTAGGFYSRSGADQDSLDYRANQANMYWQAFDRAAQDYEKNVQAFRKLTEPTAADNFGLRSPLKEAKKREDGQKLEQQATGVANLWDAYQARRSEYENEKAAYDKWRDSARTPDQIQADISAKQKEIETWKKEIIKYNSAATLNNTLGDLAQNVGPMFGQYNLGAGALENAMNAQDMVRKYEALIENAREDINLLNEELAVGEAKYWQDYINGIPNKEVQSFRNLTSPTAAENFGVRSPLRDMAKKESAQNLEKQKTEQKAAARDMRNTRYNGLDVALHWINSVVPVFSAIDELTGKTNIVKVNGIERANLNQITPEEWDNYEKIAANSSPEDAQRYLEYLHRTSLNARRRDALERGARQNIEDNPWYSDASWAALSTLTTPLKVSSFIGQTADMLVNGKMEKDAPYNDVAYWQSATRGAIANDADKWAKSKFGTDTIKIAGKDVKPASFATQSAMSVLDNLYLLGLTGGFGLDKEALSAYNQGTVNLATTAARDAAVRAENANLLTMGFSAAPDAVIEAKDRGLSDSQAYILGAAAGMFEILTEKVSLDALLEGLGNKNVGAYLLTQGVTEGSEEINSGLLNTVLDVWVSQDQSEWRQAIKKYEKDGLSKDDAVRAAFEDKMFDLAQEGAAGMLSGFAMSGGMMVSNAGHNAVDSYNQYRNAITSEQNVNGIIEEGLATKENTPAYKAAENLRAQLESGDKLTVREVKNAATVIDAQKRTDNSYVSEKIKEAEQYKRTTAYAIAANLKSKLSNNEEISVREVNTLERKIAEAKFTSADKLESVIETAKADPDSAAYKSAVKIEQKLKNGQTVSVREAMRLRSETNEALNEALDSKNADVIGSYMISESGRKALTDAATILKNSTSQSDIRRGNEMLQAIKDGNLDAKTAGDVFLRSQKILENTRNQTARVLQPREVTADMDAYDRSAAELGVSKEEAAHNKAIMQAFGVEGEYKSFENNNLSAYYDRSTGKVYINANAQNPGLALIAHEVTHSFENTAGYKKLADLVFSQSQDLNADLQRITQEYKDAGIDLDDDGARSELVSEFVEQHMFNDEKFIKDVVSTDRSLAQKFLSTIDNLLAKLGNKNAQQRQLLRHARDLWAEALQQRMTSDKAKAKIAEKRSDGKLTLPAVEAKAAAVRKTEGTNLPKAESRKIQTANAELNQYGINIDADSGAAVSYSIRTAPTTVDEIKLATDRLVNAGFDRADAENWLKSLTSVSSVIMQNMLELDYEADERYTWLKTNSEYTQGSVDFNNNCPKRAQFTAVFDRLQQMMPDRVFSASDYETIRQILIKHNISVTCGPCFVEDRRQHTGEIAQKFIDQLKSGELKNKFQSKIGNDTYIPTQYDLVTYEGLRGLYDSHRGIHDAFVAFNNARGMQAARLLEGLAEYNNQIKKWNKRTISSKNSKGGLRIFSLSDADPRNMIDMIQIVTDSAEKGLMIQGYTKKPWFARFIKDTGVRILRSHIPAGNGVRNGKLVFDNVEGINTNDPDYFDATNERNIGDTVIGINDEMIRIAMADPSIDQIIPFHTQLAKDIRDQKKIGHWTPYNGLEDRNVSDGKKADKQINIYKDVLQAWEKKGTPITNRQEFVEAFLQVCDERGLIPRFDKFLNVDENGKYVYTPGYEKFLVDYKLFDRTTGEIIPQEAVKPIFDDAYNQSVLENYVKGAKNLPKVSENVFDEIKRQFTDGKLSLPKAESKQYAISKSDTAYLKAVESGDMETAQRMVDEAAERAGYPLRLMHGTNSFGFTSVDFGESDDNVSFFATDSEEVAASYVRPMDDEDAEPTTYVRQIGKPVKNRLTEKSSAPVLLAELKKLMPDAYKDTTTATEADIQNKSDEQLTVVKDMARRLDRYSLPDNLQDTVQRIMNAQTAQEALSLFDTIKDVHDVVYNGEIFVQASAALESLRANINLLSHIANATPETVAVRRNGKRTSLVSANRLYENYLDYSGMSGRGIYDIYTTANNPLTINCRGANWKSIQTNGRMEGLGETASTREIAKWAHEHGYGTVIFENVRDTGKYGSQFTNPSTVYAFLKDGGNSFKSADPVTYDDSGKPIPLSERFNPENPDIRYAVNKDATIRDDQELRDRVREIQDQLDMAEMNGLSATEIRRLNSQLYKAQAQLDQFTAKQRGLAKKTSINDIIRSIESYDRMDLESLAEQISDSAWDDYEELGDAELREAIVDALNGRMEDMDPGDADKAKYGFYVKPAKPKGLSLPVAQAVSSAKTSIKQVPALFTDNRVKFGKVNVDIGGGKYDLASDYLKERGTKNLLFDPYNRDRSTNRATLQYLQDGNRADTATCANVLNVIAEPNARANVILETAKAIKPDGTAYFMVYEGDGSGNGKRTSAGWQNNMKTADYVSEIEQYFDNVERRGKLIIATDPKTDLPQASWEVQPGEAIRYAINKDATIRTEGELIDSVIDPKETAKAGVENALDGYLDSIGAGSDIPGMDKISTGTKRNAKLPAKYKAQEAARFFYRKMVDSGEAVTRLGRYSNDPHLYHYYNMARASSNAAVSMIQDAQTDVMGRRVGDSLNDIFSSIRKKGEQYYADLQAYLYHTHNIDRMSRENPGAVAGAQAELEQFRRDNPELAGMADFQIERLASDPISFYHDQAKAYMQVLRRLRQAAAQHNKPVFGQEVSAEQSRRAAEDLREKLSETEGFEEDVEKIYQYIDNLMQYRIDSGLITEDEYERLKEIYPHYVPTFREQEPAARNKRGNTTEIGKTVGRAQGGDTRLIPLHRALAQQTFSVVREGSKNRFGQMLLEGKQNSSRGMIKNVEEAESGFHEDTFDEEDPTPTKENTFIVRQGGKRYEIGMDNALYEAVTALSPEPAETNFLINMVHKSNDLFKALCTGYNPTFLVRNFMRDLQDAGLYSKDLSEFSKNYPLAYKEIASNGKYWQMYKALGGLYSSFFDYQTGELKQPGKVKKYTVDAIESVNMAVEQAPRLAEFMATVKKAEKAGNLSMDTLMEAIYNAADVTVNFGRSGKWGKMFNRSVVPFFNPGVQGFDKMIRNVTETKGFKDWARLAAKATILGIAPAVISRLLFGKRKDWDEIKQRDKDIYYLFPLQDGVWLKLPKGRVLSVFGMAADRIMQGKDADWASFIETSLTQTAPENPLTASYWRPWLDAKLFDKDDPGKTWYGSDIENQRLRNLAPGQRYDTTTDALSKWLGKTFNLSPKKINYLLDQYSGVIGDVLLPLTSDRAEKGLFTNAFTIDSVVSNQLSEDFYDMKDRLTWAKNDPNATGEDEALYKYWNEQTSAISDINKAIRAIEQDKSLTDKEKRDLTRVQYSLRNGIMRNALDSMSDYRAGGTDNDIYSKVSDAQAQEERESKTYNFKGQDVAWDDLSGTQKKIVQAQDAIDNDPNADLSEIIGKGNATKKLAQYQAARDQGISNQTYIDALQAIDDADDGNGNYNQAEAKAGLDKLISDGTISEKEAGTLWKIITGGADKNNPFPVGAIISRPMGLRLPKIG